MTDTATPRGFRVTVEDLETGETGTALVAPGDYFLATFGSAHLAGTQRYEKAGTTKLTIKDHRPEWPAVIGEPGNRP